MLRLEFSSADLGRVRVAQAPHPLWELALAINSVQAPNLPGRYRPWRDDAVGRQDEHLLKAAASLVPAGGRFPDSVTPPSPEREPEAHFDRILAVPRDALRKDLDRTFSGCAKVPRWAQTLYQHGRLEGVVDVLRGAHALLVEPVARFAALRVEARRACFAQLFLDGGTERLLSGLHPSIRWRDQALECAYPANRTIALDGRGLIVIPAHFCWGAPVTLLDAGRAPVLVVPADPEHAEPPGPAAALDRLTRLLGTTRARLLGELSISGSTTELAARLDLTQAAISQHTRVLRDARLISTTRLGMSVRHSLTPLGHELLRD